MTARIKIFRDNFFSENTGIILSVGGIICIVIAILVFLGFGNWKFSTNLNEEKIGQFGDFIGGVIGSLFSLAGIILFYVALKEQRRDITISQRNLELQTKALNQQIEEFRDQKKEMADTRKVYEEQTILFREQTNLYKQQNIELKEQSQISNNHQFDSSFFEHLKILSEYKSQLNQKDSSLDYFNSLKKEIEKIEPIGEAFLREFTNIKNQCQNIFYSERNYLSIYFKTLYRIMILIEESKIDIGKKIEYFKLLRSQINEDELMVLYYNFNTNHGIKIRSLVLKYNFLKHLRPLDKIEFFNNLNGEDKYKLEQFLLTIEEIIIGNINQFFKIENENEIDISFSDMIIDLPVIVKLIIRDTFCFSITVKENELTTNRMLTEDLLIDIITKQILSILYIAKFKPFNGNEISCSRVRTGEELEIKFNIEDINLI
jgi:hypothetical protein